MKGKVHAGIVAFLGLHCIVTPSWADETHASDLRIAIRELIAIQDQVAAGESSAREKQQKGMRAVEKLAAIAAEQRNVDTSTLQDFMLAALSGIEAPQLPRKDAQSTAIADLYEVIRNGDYAKAHEAEVQSTLGLAVHSRLWLMRAMGTDCKDISGSMHASRLAPGTIVEERALRQLALCALQANDARAAATSLERHARRFGRSLFRPAFFKKLARDIAELESKGQPVMAQLSPSLSLFDQESQLQLQMQLLEEGMSLGNRELVAAAARQVKSLASKGSSESETAKLYEVIALSPENAQAILAQVNAEKLPPAEAAMLSRLNSEDGSNPHSTARNGMQGSPDEAERDKQVGDVDRRVTEALRAADAALNE